MQTKSASYDKAEVPFSVARASFDPSPSARTVYQRNPTEAECRSVMVSSICEGVLFRAFAHLCERFTPMFGSLSSDQRTRSARNFEKKGCRLQCSRDPAKRYASRFSAWTNPQNNISARIGNSSNTGVRIIRGAVLQLSLLEPCRAWRMTVKSLQCLARPSKCQR
jgi:hypothetical protein